MDFVEDLGAFFEDFGVAATLGASAVIGILDESPLVAFNAVGGNNPVFTLQSADLPADPRLVSLVVGSRTFAVRSWSDDGSGVSMLSLEAQ